MTINDLLQDLNRLTLITKWFINAIDDPYPVHRFSKRYKQYRKFKDEFYSITNRLKKIGILITIKDLYEFRLNI